MTKIEACKILQIKPHTLKNLTKVNKIIEINKKEVLMSSVFEYQKELEERRLATKPNWIKNGGCASI